MEIRTDQITKGVLVSGGILAILLGLSFRPDPPQEPEPPDASADVRPSAERHRELLGQRFRIRSGDPHSPVLSIGEVQIVKRKAGPLVLPAFNLLKIEGFNLIFPAGDPSASCGFPEELQFLLPGGPDTPEQTDRNKPDVMEPVLLTRLKEKILGGLGSGKKVSGVEIRPFRISVSSGTDETVILKAEQADGRADGTLRLKNCTCLDENRTRLTASQAVFKLDDPVRLLIAGREILLRDMLRAQPGAN